MTTTFDTPLEWNSNQLVLVRMNNIIDKINASRTTKNILSLIDALVELYKEICVDIKESSEEDKVWEELVKIITSYQPINPNENIIGEISSDGRVLAKLDIIDIKLRRAAKRHGYLTSNKEDPRKAIHQR